MTAALRALPVLLFIASAHAQQLARQTFADLLKTPLDPPGVEAMVRSTTTSGGVVTEDLDWESLDGERVPAFLMRPENATGPLPALICLHGSSGSRESMSTEQFGVGDWTRYGSDEPHKRLVGWARELARRGFVTLAMTQRGLDSRGPAINTQANLMLVEGRTAMGAVLHEIRQAATYLERRPDVDPAKIGATGLSFGGITAFYVWIVDDRIAAAAPICGGVGSIASFMQLGSPSYHGTYWWLPGMLQKGDHADFAAALAPKPLMVWAPTEDIGMPREGVDRFVAQVGHAYTRMGKSEALVVHQQPGEHTFSLEAFEALTAFFKKQFGM